MPDKSSEDYDRLFKIRDFYDLITSIFSTAYIPGREVCIDEGMVRWFGRGFRTYLPSKRSSIAGGKMIPPGLTSSSHRARPIRKWGTAIGKKSQPGGGPENFLNCPPLEAASPPTRT